MELRIPICYHLVIPPFFWNTVLLHLGNTDSSPHMLRRLSPHPPLPTKSKYWVGWFSRLLGELIWDDMATRRKIRKMHRSKGSNYCMRGEFEIKDDWKYCTGALNRLCFGQSIGHPTFREVSNFNKLFIYLECLLCTDLEPLYLLSN